MTEPVLFYGFAGLVLGALISWFWRGAEVNPLRGRLKELRDLQQELEIAHASTLSERELLDSQYTELQKRTDQLQRERDISSTEHAALKARQQAIEDNHKQQLRLLEQSREQLRLEFENLANRIFEERGKQLSSHNQQSIESLLKPFGEQINRFQSRINEVHSQSIRGQESLAGELRNLMSVGLQMSDQADQLTQALKGDNKTAGNWGEVQLERTLQLAGLEKGVHYSSQSTLRDDDGKRKLPDFLIHLPDGKHLIIDSKVSLLAYEQAVSADSEEAKQAQLKAHAESLRRHINELASKEYASIRGLDSPELVFMFMPIESAYIEALKFNRDLFNEGYRKNIILVSHTTLLPMLKTIAGLWIAYRSNEEAREISEMAGDIYNKVSLVGQRLEDMGKTLATTTDKYNRTVTALVGKQGLLGKVDRFRSISARATTETSIPKTQNLPVEHDRLASLRANSGDGDLEVTSTNATSIEPSEAAPQLKMMDRHEEEKSSPSSQ
ncbi:MAG: DNA recombination protein RmuC [Pseudomonadota bacterium]